MDERSIEGRLRKLEGTARWWRFQAIIATLALAAVVLTGARGNGGGGSTRGEIQTGKLVIVNDTGKALAEFGIDETGKPVIKMRDTQGRLVAELGAGRGAHLFLNRMDGSASFQAGVWQHEFAAGLPRELVSIRMLDRKGGEMIRLGYDKEAKPGLAICCKEERTIEWLGD